MMRSSLLVLLVIACGVADAQAGGNVTYRNWTGIELPWLKYPPGTRHQELYELAAGAQAASRECDGICSQERHLAVRVTPPA